jgi:DNA modification methylase
MAWKNNLPQENIYFEYSNGVIYHCDCMEILPKVKANIIITDPPYGLKLSKGCMIGYGTYEHAKYPDDWDKKRPGKEVFDAMLNSCSNAMIFGGNYFADLLPQSTHWIFWDKKGEIKFKNNMSDGELVWTTFKKNSTKKYTCIQQGFIREDKSKRVHPTQKPIPLLYKLIKDYTNPEDIILDPFMGSGATLVAAELLGRKWIGIEREEKYCKATVERLKDYAILAGILEIDDILQKTEKNEIS